MKKKSLLPICFLLVCLRLAAQEIYYSNSFLDPVSVGTIDLDNDCAQDILIPFDNEEFARGIAIAPDGTFYAMIRNQTSDENLLSIVDLNTSTYTTAVDLSFIDLPRHLAFAPDGTLYFNFSGTLFSLDLNTSQVTDLGVIGNIDYTESLILGLTFANGKLYAAAQDLDAVEKVWQVNLDNPLDSRLIDILPDTSFGQVGSITTVNNGCGQTITYIAISEFGGHRLYEIDLNNGDLTLICNTELANFKGATSATDAAFFDCAPELDLDADDSTIVGNDFIAEETCAADSVCFFSDTDIQITSSFLVDSLQIYFFDTPPDGNSEAIFCKQNTELNCIENNTNGSITLINTPELDDADLSQALNNSVYYQNLAAIPTFGNRTFAVIAFDSCFISDTAFVTLPILTPIPDTSFFALCPTESFEYNGEIFTTDTTVCTQLTNFEGCDSFSCVNLVFAFPETQLTDVLCEGETYLFSNEILTAGGVYRDTLPTGGICDSIVVLTLEEIPTPMITFLGNSTFCEGTTTEISVDETYDFYAWSTSETTQNITASAVGTYATTVTNAEGCTASNEITLTFENPLEVNTLVNDLTCDNLDNGSIRVDSVSGGVSPYIFSLNGGAFSAATSFENLTAGNYDLVIEDAAGCQLVVSPTIDEPIPLFLSINELFDINLGDSIVVNLQTNATAIQNIELNPIGSFNPLDSTQFLFFPQQNTDYSLVLTDENGCTAAADFTFLVQQTTPVFAPNVFSPNQDGINDVFQIFTSASVQSIENFRILNRWGGLVFDNQNATFWDGNFNGESAEMGVYVYFVEYTLVNGQRAILEGDLLLLR